MFKNILVPVNGSDYADMAVCVAANLYVITAFDPVPAYVGEYAYQAAVHAQREEARKVPQEAIKIVGELPGKLESDVQEGQPADTILRTAKIHRVDPIMMGARGLGTISGIAVVLRECLKRIIQQFSLSAAALYFL